MSNHFEEYNETTDRYLQILWAAQMVEDRRLMIMIKKRLNRNARTLFATDSGCKVIAFPCVLAPSSGPPVIPASKKRRLWSANPLLHFAQMVEKKGLWPEKPFAHVISICLSYGALIMLLSLAFPF